jgi:hypothetical protein
MRTIDRSRHGSSSPRTPSRQSITDAAGSPPVDTQSTAIPSPSRSIVQSPNYHPYRSRTSSSGVLSRSNSSPAQPLASLAGHRPSRSMNNLRSVVEPGETAPTTSEAATNPVRDVTKRRSVDGNTGPWSTKTSRVGGPVHSRRSSHMGGGRTTSFNSNDVSDASTTSSIGLRRTGSTRSLAPSFDHEADVNDIKDLPVSFRLASRETFALIVPAHSLSRIRRCGLVSASRGMFRRASSLITVFILSQRTGSIHRTRTRRTTAIKQSQGHRRERAAFHTQPTTKAPLAGTRGKDRRLGGGEIS